MAHLCCDLAHDLRLCLSRTLYARPNEARPASHSRDAEKIDNQADRKLHPQLPCLLAPGVKAGIVRRI
jgi:hypothetical protein